MRPAFWIGRFLWKKGDGTVIDGLGPDGVSARVLDAARGAVRLQSGYVYHYALAMLLGVVALATWFMAIGRWAVNLPILSPCHLRAADRRRADPAVAARRCGALDRAGHHHRHLRLVAAGVGASSIPTIPASSWSRKRNWLGGGISYHMGVDGISMLFVVLTAGLMPFCIAASWKSIEDRVAEYMIAFLVLETMMIGVFCALDLVLFYVLFEGGLIPMFLIIGIWGGKRRVYASFKFFLYTFVGSVLMLLAIMSMYWYAGTTDIAALLNGVHFPPQMQTWLWLAFFASFAVKMPMWPVHTWLPDAHVEAPTAGSVILAAILLKMGGYGFLRFSLPMFPSASEMFAPLIFTMSIVAIIYTSLVALAQEDMKKLIAYSSVAHMGFVTMGIFTLTHQGVEGGIFQMLSHGVVSGALFLCVGVVYDRMHTREISAYGGLVNRMPIYAACFMVFTLANVGLPGTSGFVGEFLTMLGAYLHNSWIAIFAATGRDPVGGLCAVPLSPHHLRRPGQADAPDHPGPDGCAKSRSWRRWW